MKTTPLKGMKDILPREQRIRDYVQGEILKTYRAAGFERISTPIMEDMAVSYTHLTLPTKRIV